MRVRTACRHCQRPIQLTIGSDLKIEAETNDSTPLVFRPDVDWGRFEDPSIIHAF